MSPARAGLLVQADASGASRRSVQVVAHEHTPHARGRALLADQCAAQASNVYENCQWLAAGSDGSRRFALWGTRRCRAPPDTLGMSVAHARCVDAQRACRSCPDARSCVCERADDSPTISPFPVGVTLPFHLEGVSPGAAVDTPSGCVATVHCDAFPKKYYFEHYTESDRYSAGTTRSPPVAAKRYRSRECATTAKIHVAPSVTIVGIDATTRPGSSRAVAGSVVSCRSSVALELPYFVWYGVPAWRTGDQVRTSAGHFWTQQSSQAGCRDSCRPQ
jgi:hypothetical protein